jgi:glycosyltransferase involved in cell wall biosynthesis
VSVETSVIIPTLDDAATLGKTVARLNMVMAGTGSPAEAVLVDMGSSDRTLDVAAELADRFPLLHLRLLVQDRTHHSGFGTALRLGVAYSQGRFCVVLMPDARDPLELIPVMLDELRGGAHLVLCSRFEAKDGHSPYVPRRFAVYQSLYRRAIRLLLGTDIPDSTYGFRAFNRTFVQALGISARRFAVCPEITFKVLLAGGRTERVPGAPTGPMLREQSKFRLGHEMGGYALTLLRAALHRIGIRWF